MNAKNIGWIICAIAAVAAIAGGYLFWGVAGKFSGLKAEDLRNLIFLVGGLTAGIIAFWRAWVADKQTKINEQGQITERFTRAVEQLGDDNAYMRMGAIQALRLIGSDSESHVLAVLHLLASFVREKSPAKKVDDVGFSPQQKKSIPRNEQEIRIHSIIEDVFKSFPNAQRVNHIPGDVQKSIVAIGKLAEKYGAFLMEMGKIHMDLSQSDLAYLRPIMECGFSRCMFMRSDISGAVFSHCDFRMASFHSAELYAVLFIDCDCSVASFDDAYLNYAVFNRADTDMASFKSAFCNRTDFSTARNLTTEMLKDVIYDAETPPIVPKGVKLPPPRKKEA